VIQAKGSAAKIHLIKRLADLGYTVEIKPTMAMA
jgi:hypothetical protein